MPTPRPAALLRRALLLGLWYASSSFAVLTTKALFSGIAPRLAPFPFALTLTATNNVVASLASALFAAHQSPALVPDQSSARIAAVIGAATAAEIALSNLALNLLSVSFSTLLKAMAPLFVFGCGLVLGIHRLRLAIVASLLTIAAGLVLAVSAEHKHTSPALAHFLRLGFLAQLASALFSAFRWVLTQLFIKHDPLLNHSVARLFNYRPPSKPWSAMQTVRRVSPFTLCCVLPFVVLLEGPNLFSWFRSASLLQTLTLLALLSVIGAAVFVLLWAEYELVRVTSSLTVSVAFVVKEMLLMFAATLMFRDRLPWPTCVGFAAVQAGVVLYASQSDRRSGERGAGADRRLLRKPP